MRVDELTIEDVYVMYYDGRIKPRTMMAIIRWFNAH